MTKPTASGTSSSTNGPLEAQSKVTTVIVGDVQVTMGSTIESLDDDETDDDEPYPDCSESDRAGYDGWLG